jgi:hypothetical protein
MQISYTYSNTRRFVQTKALLLVVAVLGAAFFMPAAFALQLHVIPVLPPVITNPDVSTFDIFGTGVTSPMFVIRIDNTGDTAHTGLRLRYKMFYVEAGNPPDKLYEGISNTFGIAAGSVLVVNSSDFLKKNNTSSEIYIQSTSFDVGEAAFKQKLFNSQRMPDGELTFELTLLKGWSEFSSDGFSCQVLNASNVECVSPGAPAPSSPLTIADEQPVFIWTSDLQIKNGVDYGDAFELCLYKARSGESMAEAVSRAPVFRKRTSELQLKYPAQAPDLIPGAVYYWQVTGFLRGITSSQIKSGFSSFRLQAPLNAEMQEILALLRLIYDESVLEQIYDYSEDVTVIIDGETVDASGLRKLVTEITAGKAAIQSTTVR